MVAASGIAVYLELPLRSGVEGELLPSLRSAARLMTTSTQKCLICGRGLCSSRTSCDLQAVPEADEMRSKNWWLLLLLIPFVLLLYPPLYAHRDPEFYRIPFFIWYQFLLVLVSAVLTAFVYRVRS